jgi:hypothetical protein
VHAQCRAAGSGTVYVGYAPIALPGWDVRREDFEKAPAQTYFASREIPSIKGSRMRDKLVDVIENEARLEALRRTSLLDSPPEEAFDRLTRLATTLLRVPVSIVSLVDDNRVFLKSQCGVSATAENSSTSALPTRPPPPGRLNRSSTRSRTRPAPPTCSAIAMPSTALTSSAGSSA